MTGAREGALWVDVYEKALGLTIEERGEWEVVK